MPTNTRERLITNFSAGPAMLPTEVVQRFTHEFGNYGPHGISIAEYSHRSAQYEALHHDTIAKIRRILAVPQDYEILLVAGGASLQFALIAYNFAHTQSVQRHTESGDTEQHGNGAAYCVTGAWARKARESAERALGAVSTVYDGAPHHYSHLPQWDELSVAPHTPYLHITSNETIHGLQFKQWPNSTHQLPPLVADMSSDLMSKPIPVSRFAMIYASAQKNMGLAGVTLVIIRRSFLKCAHPALPAYMSYRTHADAASLYNTPPIVSIFSVNLMLDWIAEQGGVIKMNTRNLEKAHLFYSYLDEHSDFYHNPITNPADRSVMNAIFTLPNEELTQRFLSAAQEKQIIGINGHRSVGGCRVSLYNAIELRAVERLIDVMSAFRRRH